MDDLILIIVILTINRVVIQFAYGKMNANGTVKSFVVSCTAYSFHFAPSNRTEQSFICAFHIFHEHFPGFFSYIVPEEN